MKAAYIWASAFWQVSILAGGATMTHLSGNGWWITGALIMTFLSGYSFSKRLDGWRDDEADT
jgi:hypothetical protein